MVFVLVTVILTVLMLVLISVIFIQKIGVKLVTSFGLVISLKLDVVEEVKSFEK